MKIISGKATARSKNHGNRTLAIALITLLIAPLSRASQSSIEQRFSFNSDRQLGSITSGAWGINDQSFLNGSFVHTRSPSTVIAGVHDTFYQGGLGAGYAINNIAFDIGFQISKSPLTETSSIGGSFGFTYIFIPPGANAEDYEPDALSVSRAQVYQKPQEQPPLFWVRFGYTGNSMSSDVVGFPNNVGKETGFTFDGYYPVNDDILVNIGLGFHGYDDSRGFYSLALENVTTAKQLLLLSTIQGLPHSNISLGLTWQYTQRDALVPRYQGTEIDSSRQWAHTIDLAWRHQFSKNWFLTPTYEATVYQATASTGLLLGLLYIF